MKNQDARNELSFAAWNRWCVVELTVVDDYWDRGAELTPVYVMAESFNVSDKDIVRASGSYDAMKAAKRLLEGT